MLARKLFTTSRSSYFSVLNASVRLVTPPVNCNEHGGPSILKYTHTFPTRNIGGEIHFVWQPGENDLIKRCLCGARRREEAREGSWGAGLCDDIKGRVDVA